MIPSTDIRRSIIFDIESIPNKTWNELSDREMILWKSIASKLRLKNEECKFKSDKELWPMAGLYAEFGRIVCLSVAIYNEEKNTCFYKSFSNENEVVLINNFLDFIANIIDKLNFIPIFGGFNIENFDLPFIIKRILINEIKLPDYLNFYQRKPWDVYFLDLAKIWMQIGMQDRYMIKLDVLLHALNIESSKSVISGSDVYQYYLDGKIEQIVEYCNKDAICTLKAALKLSNINIDIETINLKELN